MQRVVASDQYLLKFGVLILDKTSPWITFVFITGVCFCQMWIDIWHFSRRNQFMQPTQVYWNFQKAHTVRYRGKKSNHQTSKHESAFSIFSLTVQMAKAGVDLNFEKECRHNWLFCALPIITAFALLVISFAFDVKEYTQNIYFVFFQRSMLHASAMSPIILLRNLYERFVLINYHLRYYFKLSLYYWSLESDFLRKLWHALNRNQFLNGDHVPKNSGKIDSIDFIKFVGHQHSALVEILDRINFCYAFHVFVLIDMMNVKLFYNWRFTMTLS